MGESASLPPVNVAATPRVAKKHKVDSRRHQFPKIIIPGGRVLRSSASRGTLQSSSDLRPETAKRNKSRVPVDEMDTIEDNTGVLLEGTTPLAQVPIGLVLSPPKPPPKARNLARPTSTKSQEKKKKAVVVKAAAEVFRFLPREMPADMGGLAVRCHTVLHSKQRLITCFLSPYRRQCPSTYVFCGHYSTQRRYH